MPMPLERSFNDLVDAAFRQASARAILQARQTGTPLIVWKDGRVQAISADEAEAESAGGTSGAAPAGGDGPVPPTPR